MSGRSVAHLASVSIAICLGIHCPVVVLLLVAIVHVSELVGAHHVHEVASGVYRVVLDHWVLGRCLLTSSWPLGASN